ncbi:TetR family transcriptional regulator [Nocardia anaemiae]|uniref:TetR family transcriptional regulator n=1 Tax=Nocardia anaemiae TaxID=263910 RepID=UPI0007A49293|nr:TetR family transcriptional regulator [Nocardia anaemiae]
MLESSTPIGASATAENAVRAPANPGPSAPGGLGLRERKKQQTRLRIIEVALDLCDAQGFDATTVEQIAARADVSPRTINRYFDSKEAIILGPVKDFGLAIAECLRGLPVIGNELQSLREAFLLVVDQASVEVDGTLSFRRFQQMQRILRSSPTVSAQSMELADDKNAAIAAVIAERLGTEPDALPVRLVIGAWQLIGHLSMECQNSIFDEEDTAAAAAEARNGLTTSFDEFMRVCTGQPTTDPAETR